MIHFLVKNYLPMLMKRLTNRVVSIMCLLLQQMMSRVSLLLTRTLSFQTIYPSHSKLLYVCAQITSLHSNKSGVSGNGTQYQLRWDKGNIESYYHYTGVHLSPLVSNVDNALQACAAGTCPLHLLIVWLRYGCVGSNCL